MNKSYMRRLVLVLMIAFYVKSEAFWWENYKAVSWTSKQLSNNRGGNKYIFVEFYTKSCEYCQKLYPKMNKVIDYFTGPNSPRRDILFVKVDGEQSSRIMDDLGINQFPMLYTYKPGDKLYPDQYMFDHSFEEIRDYLKALPPAPGFDKKDKNSPGGDTRDGNGRSGQSEVDKKEIEALKKRLKELQEIQKDTEVVTPALFKDLISQHNKSIKLSVKKLIRSVKKMKRSTIKLEIGSSKRETTALSVASISGGEEEDTQGEKDQGQEEEEEDFEYKHAWLVRTFCLFCVGAVFALLAQRLRSIDKAKVR